MIPRRRTVVINGIVLCSSVAFWELFPSSENIGEGGPPHGTAESLLAPHGVVLTSEVTKDLSAREIQWHAEIAADSD